MNRVRINFFDFHKLLFLCIAVISSFSCANDAKFGNLGKSESKEASDSSNNSSSSAEKNPFTYPANTDVVEIGNPADQPSPGTGTGTDARKLNLYFDLPDSGRYFAMRMHIQRVVFTFENGKQIEQSFSPAFSAFFGPITQNESNKLVVELGQAAPTNNIKGVKIQLDRNGEVELFESNSLQISIKKMVEGASIDAGNSNIIDTGDRELNSKISLPFEENSGSEFITFSPNFVSGSPDLKIFSGKSVCQDGAYFEVTECFTRTDVIEKIYRFCDGKVSPLSGKTGVETFTIIETCK